MNRTAIFLFGLLCGVVLADGTNPNSDLREWARGAQITDSEVGCSDDCLDEVAPMPPAQTLACAPSKDQTYLRCEVL